MQDSKNPNNLTSTPKTGGQTDNKGVKNATILNNPPENEGKALNMSKTKNQSSPMEKINLEDQDVKDVKDLKDTNYTNPILDKEERKKLRSKNLEDVILSYLLGINIEERNYTGHLVSFHTNYMSEKDFIFGDYVMVFPNPDHPSYKSDLNYTFNFFETLQMLKKFFAATRDDDSFFNKAFNRAFGLAFNQLQNAEKKGKKPHYVKRINKKAGDKKEKPANSEIYEELGIKFYDEKINIGGGYLAAVNSHQSFFSSPKEFTRTEEWTKDLCTLIRNMMIVKLAKEYGFLARTFISDDAKEIFLVLHAEQHNLHFIAEDSSIDKEIELAISDLMSLEPVDQHFRPLRLHSFLWKNDYLKQKRMDNKANNQLKKEIIEHLKRIDYKKISHEVNCKNFLDQEKSGAILDEADVAVKTWKIYLQYLKLLAPLVEKAREDFNSSQIYDLEKEIALEAAENLKRGPRAKFQDMNVNTNEHPVISKHVRKIKERMRVTYNYQLVKRVRFELLAQKYKKAFLECLKTIQKKNGKNSLKNLWNYAGIKRPLESFSDFYNPSTSISFKKKNRLVAIWKKYQINEIGMTSVFLNMEKLKLIQRMLDSMFNLSVIKEHGFLLDYFFLNDPYNLKGISVAKSFTKFREEFIKTFTEKKTIQDSVFEKNKEEQYFYPIQRLSKVWSGLFKLPLRAVRDYYGEKIALFFSFLKYYIYCSIVMSFFGIPMFFLERYFVDVSFFSTGSNDDGYIFDQKIKKGATFIFCIFTAVWASLISELWDGKEKIFTVKYGQTEFELEELELSSFEGNFRRSFYNDNMNEEYTNGVARVIYYFIAFVLALCLFIGNVAVTIGLIYLAKDISYENEDDFFYTGIFVPALINTFYVLFTGWIYEKLCVGFTSLENHRTASDYELSFTVKVLLFKSVNRLIPLVLIAFINNYFSWGCGDGLNCWDYLIVYYRSMLYVFFAYQILQYLCLLLVFLIKKTRYSLFANDSKNKHSTYYEVNKFIMSENIKLDFSPSEELDGTLNDYINMSVNFSMNSLFGVCFPLCFPMSVVSFLISMHFAKFKLTTLCQRPKPLGACTVGASKVVFHLVGYLSVLSNAGLICSTTNILSGQYALTYFVIIIMVIFILKFFVQRFMVKVSHNVDLVLRRNSMIASKTVKSSKVQSSGGKKKKMVASLPIFKVFGTLLEKPKRKKTEEEDALKKNEQKSHESKLNENDKEKEKEKENDKDKDKDKEQEQEKGKEKEKEKEKAENKENKENKKGKKEEKNDNGEKKTKK